VAEVHAGADGSTAIGSYVRLRRRQPGVVLKRFAISILKKQTDKESVTMR
tara:strand:- start:13790 stop:13939 length:150 start_codon:yes stop_codon:yes gene_type:complete